MTSFDIGWLRDIFLDFDTISNPIMGISDWDDSACVQLGNKKLVMSCDGPYKKRLVMKSALIHAATDVIVKGAKPLFALDTLSGTKKQVAEMAGALKDQGMRMKIPIVGGNTNLEGEASASIFVIGELLLKEPIRDSSGQKGDTLLLIGDPLWGEPEERFCKAESLFSCWYEIIKKTKINAAKDVTKGGLENTAAEIAEHSHCNYKLNNLNLHKFRNLDNFLLSVDPNNLDKVKDICFRLACTSLEAGRLI